MIDLHTHSTSSDGSLTPTDLAKQAIEIGLTAIALTDHDVVGGIEEFMQVLDGSSTMGIAGSELGAMYPGVEVEVIAMDIKNLLAYKEREKKLIKIRNETHLKRIDLLNKMGMKITWDDIALDENGEPRKLIGKPHICEFLLKKGYAETREDVYKKILGEGCCAYVKKNDPELHETINFIRQNGDVAIMAHPILSGLEGQDLFNYIKTAKGMGLMGIEVFHSKHNKDTQLEYLKIAQELNLIVSGGSDFHGSVHPDVSLGIGTVDENGQGNVNIPDMILEPILNRSNTSSAYYKELELHILGQN